MSDGTDTANINFAGNYVLENFTLSNDGSGGTLIIDPPVISTGNDGSSDAQSFSFNLDALRNPMSNLRHLRGLPYLKFKKDPKTQNDHL